METKNEKNPEVIAPDVRGITIADTERVIQHLQDALAIFSHYVDDPDGRNTRRGNAVGMKRAGFVRTVLEVWKINEQFAPSYYNMSKINALNNEYDRYTQIIATSKEVMEMATKARIIFTSQLYRAALSFYDGIKRAALLDDIPEAKSIYRTLEPYFKTRGNRNTDLESPTQKQLLKDAKAVIAGRKDGKLLLENETPKLTKGKHVAIDEMGTLHESEKVEVYGNK